MILKFACSAICSLNTDCQSQVHVMPGTARVPSARLRDRAAPSSAKQRPRARVSRRESERYSRIFTLWCAETCACWVSRDALRCVDGLEGL